MQNHFLLLLLCFVTVHSKSIIPVPPSVPIGPFHLQSYNESNHDTKESPLGDDQEQGYDRKTLFQGDIKESGRKTGERIGEAGTRTPWPNGIIPYVFDCSVLSIKSAVEATKAAMEEWESRTCVRFVKKQKHHKVYLEFIRAAGCWATYVGYKGKKTQISIGKGCDYKHVMVHELGHVIGFWHEQSRPDRNDYIRLNEGNIVKGLKHNFDIVREQVYNYGEPYDFNSIMHYPFNAFAIDPRQNTIITKDPNLQYTARPYKELSESDVRQTNRMYQCNKVMAVRAPERKSVDKAKRLIGLASIGGQCEDQHQNCKDWAKANFCTLSPDPMLKTCPKSCGVCSKVCKDNFPDCFAWAEYGHCRRTSKNTDQTIKFMLNNCKKSCGVCTPAPTMKAPTKSTTTLPPTTTSPPTTTPTPSTETSTTIMTTEGPPVITKGGISTPSKKFTGVLCKDRSKHCKHWAEDGRCKTDRWVLDNCLLSCYRSNSPICDRNIIKPVGPCTDILGVHSKTVIPDNRMYAPTTFVPGGGWYAPASSARLYKKDDHRLKHVGAWCADPRSNREKYLQIDFGSRKRITALATQGRDEYFEHVKSYSLSFSNDGSSWYDYRESGTKKILDGNCDHVTPVLNLLEKGQNARYIRIHPIKYVAAACLRVEVYGCNA